MLKLFLLKRKEGTYSRTWQMEGLVVAAVNEGEAVELVKADKCGGENYSVTLIGMAEASVNSGILLEDNADYDGL